MKCFLCNFLRYCLLIYMIVATGGTIMTRTRTRRTTTKTTTIMTIEETSPMDANNCQTNVQCCYYQEALQQKQQQQHLSDKKDIKLTKREIDERLQQPFTIMQSIEEEMEPEDENENENEEANKNDHIDNEDYEENSLDDDENEDEDEEENKASKKKIRQRIRRRRRKRKRKNGNKSPKRRKRRKNQHVTVSPLGQPANLLLASLTQLPTAPPIHYAHKYKPHRITRRKNKKKKKITATTTTGRPKLKPLKYLLNKGNLIKKKKQEYLSHLGYVFLPLVKFVAFFTVLNPFTLAVFFFMLISPVVFGLLGFTALSFILRPAMNLLFAVKHRIGNINRNNRRHKQRKHNHIAPRPITIHKHFYPQPRPNVHPPLFLRQPTRPLLYQPHPHPHPHRADNVKDISFHNSTELANANGLVNVQQTHQNFNPLLPQVRQQLKQIQPPAGLSTRFILPSL